MRMKATGLLSLLAVLIVLALPGLAALATACAPINGFYKSVDLGGQFLTGRASTWRSGINSGLPHVVHIQSWDGANLGAQWTLDCMIENAPFSTADNRVNGAGTVVYTSTFSGGTFNLAPGAWPWGDGAGTLDPTTLVTSVQFVMIGGVSTPVASVVNGVSSGSFLNGCLLSFVIANGSGVGETSSLNPSLTKPATYPLFQDAGCGPAPASQQFGTWGDVLTITLGIDCSVPASQASWSRVKASYR